VFLGGGWRVPGKFLGGQRPPPGHNLLDVDTA
jgi:hypothetical protein